MRTLVFCAVALHAMPALAIDPVSIPLDGDARSGLARELVTAEAHGKVLSCEGVALAAVLREAGALPAEKASSALLDHYVVVTARDKYRVTYSLAEIDPGTGNRAVYLIDKCDGKPLDAKDGPLRLLTPADERPARWVRQVESITVFDPE